MSVPKSERTVTTLKVYTNALKLRDEITMFALHDFGAKKKVKEGREMVLKNLTDDEKKTILEIIEREHSNPVIVERFPLWFLDSEREFLLEIARKMVMSICAAYTIYPESFDELDTRRHYMTDAIICVEAVLQELTYIQRVLRVNVNKMRGVVETSNDEIRLLKNWRRSDNRFRKEIRKHWDNGEYSIKDIEGIIQLLADYAAINRKALMDNGMAEYVFPSFKMDIMESPIPDKTKILREKSREIMETME